MVRLIENECEQQQEQELENLMREMVMTSWFN